MNDSSRTISTLSAGSHTVTADYDVTRLRERNRRTSFKDARHEMSLEVHEVWIYAYRYSRRCNILSEKFGSTKINTNYFHATQDISRLKNFGRSFIVLFAVFSDSLNLCFKLGWDMWFHGASGGAVGWGTGLQAGRSQVWLPIFNIVLFAVFSDTLNP